MTYKEKVIDLLKRLMAATKKKRDYLERYECSEDVKRLDGGLNFANNFLVALTSIKEDPVPEKIGNEPEGFVVEGKTITVNKHTVDDQPRFNLDVDENNVFTEPAESEDEKIRKYLVEFINLSDNPKKVEMLAYLEKQKYDRMKPIYDARESFESALERAWNDYHNGYENVDKLEDDYVECAHAKGFREGYLFGIEKQKEQKPVVTHDENGDAILSDFEAALFSAFSDAWQTYLNGENVNVVEWAKEHAPELLRVAVKPAERVELNKSLTDAVMAELSKYSGENYWKSPWAIDSTGFHYPLYFANLGATWQKEQKPEQYSPLCDTVKDKIREYITNHFIADTVVKTDIKSIVKAMEEGVRLGKESLNLTWSEEDEKNLKQAIQQMDFLEEYIDDDGSFITESAKQSSLGVCRSVRNWLKSLPERFNLSPKQESSEEGMKVLNSIIDDYEKAAKSFCGYDGKIGFLKAIRDGEYDLPKQKWSEEDSIHLTNAILSAEKEWGAESCTAKWLEFLPERFNLQPKQEWSEEDENNLNKLLQWDGIPLGLRIWVSGLPEKVGTRPSWKPSEEQMEVLRKYVMGEWKGLTFKEDEHLKSLLIDLENYSHDNR